MKTRPTIKDIASMVGVSPTTVSYVMSGNPKHRISEKTRQSVIDAANKLQYIPNDVARSLKNNNSNCISVALEKPLTQIRFGALIQGIRNVLQNEGYRLMLFNFDSHGPLYPDFIESVLQRRTDGIIYISSDGSSPPPEWSKVIISNKLPFIACDCCPPEKELAFVCFDYERGAYEVACRLYGEGARKILYWRPSIFTEQEKYREAGLKKATALYPNVELKILTIPYEEVHDTHEYERKFAFSQLCKQHLAQDVIPTIASFEPGDAIVCSWSIMVKLLCFSLSKTFNYIKIANLSDAYTPEIPNLKVLSSRPRFLLGGEECARMLLTQLRGEPLKCNYTLIAPDTPEYLEF